METTFVRGSADDYLGPASSRFFGSGYRRIGEVIRDVTMDVGDGGHGSVQGTAQVVFPGDWSVKRRGGIPPHLSTIDAVVFTAQLAELYLTAAYGLCREDRRRSRLRRVDIRAGSAPAEEGLDRLPVSAALRSTLAAPESPLGHVSQLACRIGQMSVRCEVEHPIRHPAAATALALSTPDELLGPSSQRPYGDGFRNRRHALTDVAVSDDALAVTAQLAVAPSDPDVPATEGFEGAYQPSVTLVDAFVVALQLGQILLYQLDGVERADSQTLWMRRTTLEASAPRRASGLAAPVRAELADPELVDAKDGVWRSADIVASCHGVTTRCFVSHRLLGTGPDAGAGPGPSSAAARPEHLVRGLS